MDDCLIGEKQYTANAISVCEKMICQMIENWDLSEYIAVASYSATLKSCHLFSTKDRVRAIGIANGNDRLKGYFLVLLASAIQRWPNKIVLVGYSKYVGVH